MSAMLLAALAIGNWSQVHRVEFALDPIPPNATKIQAWCIGHSPTEVFAALKARRITKGEFESEAEFASREAKAFQGCVYANCAVTSYFAFQIDAKLTYDAEEQSWICVHRLKSYQGSFSTSPQVSTSPDVDELGSVLGLGLEKDSLGTPYSAQNGFGAKTTVEVIKRRATGLLIPSLNGWSNLVSGRYAWRRGTGFIEGKMARDAAEHAKGYIRVLAVGTLVPPYAVGAVATESATLQKPIEVRSTLDLIPFKLEGFLMVDISTGAVIGRESPPAE